MSPSPRGASFTRCNPAVSILATSDNARAQLTSSLQASMLTRQTHLCRTSYTRIGTSHYVEQNPAAHSSSRGYRRPQPKTKIPKIHKTPLSTTSSLLPRNPPDHPSTRPPPIIQYLHGVFPLIRAWRYHISIALTTIKDTPPSCALVLTGRNINPQTSTNSQYLTY